MLCIGIRSSGRSPSYLLPVKVYLSLNLIYVNNPFTGSSELKMQLSVYRFCKTDVSPCVAVARILAAKVV